MSVAKLNLFALVILSFMDVEITNTNVTYLVTHYIQTPVLILHFLCTKIEWDINLLES